MPDRYQQLGQHPDRAASSPGRSDCPPPPRLERYRARPAGDLRPGAARRRSRVAAGPAAGQGPGRRCAPTCSPSMDARSAQGAAAEANLDAGDLEPRGGRRRTSASRRSCSTRRGIDVQRAARAGLGVPAPDDPPRRELRTGDRARHSARGLRTAAAQAHRPARARGPGPRDRQGGQTGRDRPAACTSRPGGEDAARVDAALLPLAPKSAFVSGQVIRIGPAAAPLERARLGAPAGRQGRRS